MGETLMKYWLLEIQQANFPERGWGPVCIIQNGELRDHLKTAAALLATHLAVKDARIRAIDMAEGRDLVAKGIKIRTYVGED